MASRAAHPALDGADGDAADAGCLLIGEAGSADEHQGLALVVRQLAQRNLEVGQIEMTLLRGVRREPACVVAVGILNLAAALADLRVVMIAQDGEEPGLEVGALLEAVDIRPGLDQGLLDEIIGTVGLAAKRHGKGPQRADRAQQFFPEARGDGHFLWLSSSFARSWTRRSGIGAFATSS